MEHRTAAPPRAPECLFCAAPLGVALRPVVRCPRCTRPTPRLPVDRLAPEESMAAATVVRAESPALILQLIGEVVALRVRVAELEERCRG